jgi:hypothetical protein
MRAHVLACSLTRTRASAPNEDEHSFIIVCADAIVVLLFTVVVFWLFFFVHLF